MIYVISRVFGFLHILASLPCQYSIINQKQLITRRRVVYNDRKTFDHR